MNSTRQDFLNFLSEHEPEIVQLPERERDILNLFKLNMTQKEMALILGVTQGAISSRIFKIKKRLIYFHELKDYNLLESLEKDLKSLGIDSFLINLVKYMVKTSSQSETARFLNNTYDFKIHNKMNQVKVRYRFRQLLEYLKNKKNPLANTYYDFLLFVNANLYMTYEVKLPHFNGRY
jgi:predicted transcriptional regulator